MTVSVSVSVSWTTGRKQKRNSTAAKFEYFSLAFKAENQPKGTFSPTEKFLLTGFRIFKACWVLFASKYSKTSQKELFLRQKSSFCLVFGFLKLAGWFWGSWLAASIQTTQNPPRHVLSKFTQGGLHSIREWRQANITAGSKRETAQQQSSNIFL